MWGKEWSVQRCNVLLDLLSGEVHDLCVSQSRFLTLTFSISRWSNRSPTMTFSALCKLVSQRRTALMWSFTLNEEGLCIKTVTAWNDYQRSTKRKIISAWNEQPERVMSRLFLRLFSACENVEMASVLEASEVILHVYFWMSRCSLRVRKYSPRPAGYSQLLRREK